MWSRPGQKSPKALRQWERDLAQWSHVSGSVMDEITRMQTLCHMLPSDLRERITGQLSSNSMTYSSLREYVLAQVARKASDATKKPTEPPAAEVDLADYEEDWDDDDADHPTCFWTTPAGRWAFTARRGKGKSAGKGKGTGNKNFDYTGNNQKGSSGNWYDKNNNGGFKGTGKTAPMTCWLCGKQGHPRSACPC